MKKFVSILLVMVFAMGLVACGNDKVVNGKHRGTIGLINIIVSDSTMVEPKYPDVKYQVIWGNVIWGALFFYTAIAPIYFFGFSMFEPVGPVEKGN